MNPSTNVASEGKSTRQSALRRHWWVLALVVLIALVVVIYVLSHLSAADSEMYPTTMVTPSQAVRMC